ncbi:hypothetical protein H9P43_003201 [Blastocladiella emersonii ATCC 22665]|nr:hypothetical protein H9P43_003201 [Blastocladiella emersonii ATCC 22665]
MSFMSFFAPIGPMFTGLDMLIRYNAAYESIDPAIERLQRRLESLRFLLRSIHELKPKHLALSDLFSNAQKHVTQELMAEFEVFLADYSRGPKEHKQKIMRKLARTGDKLKKIALSTKNEMTLRRMDEAVSKVVGEVNTLLQVEEMYNLNNMSDSLRAVLGGLKDMPAANEQLIREMEARVLGNLKGMREMLGDSRQSLKGINASISLIAKDLASVHKTINAVPPYLKHVQSTEIRDLWRNREWADCIPLAHFARAFGEFVDYTFATLAPKIQEHVVNRMCQELLDRAAASSNTHSKDYIAPSDLDRMIPRESQLIDYMLGLEFGWVLYLDHLNAQIAAAAESLEANPRKTATLHRELSTVLAPFAAQFPIGAEYKADAVVSVQRNLDVYRGGWPADACAVVDAVQAVAAALTDASPDDVLFSALDPRVAGSAQLFGAAHAAIAAAAHHLFALMDVELPAGFAPLDDVDPADADEDTMRNSALLAQLEVVRRNLARVLADEDTPAAIAAVASSAVAKLFIRMTALNLLTPATVAGLTNCFTATHHGIPVLVHPTGIPSASDLPADLVAFLRRAHAQPHPSLLHVLGLAVYQGHWTLVMERPAMPCATLDTVLADAGRHLSLAARVSVARDIAAAVEYLHAEGVPVAALATRAVLVDRRGNVKLVGGFRAAAWIDEGEAAATLLRYASPEMAAGFAGPRGSLDADMWSMGAVFVALLTGKEFFDDVSDEALAAHLAECEAKGGAVALPTLPALDSRLLEVIADCLRTAPAERPTIEDLLGTLEQLIEEGAVQVEDSAAVVAGSGLVDGNGSQAGSVRNGSVAFPPPRVTSRSSTAYSVGASSTYSGSLPPYDIGSPGSPGQWQQMPAQGVYPSHVRGNGAGAPVNMLAQAIQEYNSGKGDVQRAIQMFDTAYLTYQQYDALHYLGNIFYFGAPGAIEPDYQRAYEYYLKATQNGSRLGHVGLGDCYLFNLGLPEPQTLATRLQQARHHYTLAYRDHPSPPARLLCGLADLQYYSKQGETRLQYRPVQFDQDAISMYQRAATLEQGYYRAQVGLADCCLAAGDRDTAKELYLSVADAMPTLRRVFIGLSLCATDHEDRESYGVMSESPDVSDH